MTIPEFKYKSTFEFPVRVVYAREQGNFMSLASLDEIKALAPSDADIKGNFDLLYNVFNAAVINRINKNHDGMDAATAVKTYKNFIHKPMNIEHDRSMVVGHIINAGFSQFRTNKPLSEEDAAASKDPFYLSLSAVVYKVVDAELCNLLVEAADETSPHFNSIATSWEVGFNSYNILLGHKDINEGELITDAKQIEAFSKYLKIYGGSGTLEDGTPVYRVITGDVLPLGCGYTTAPAAEVEGVLPVLANASEIEGESDAKAEEVIVLTATPEEKSTVEIEETPEVLEEAAASDTEKDQKNKEFQKNSSQTKLNIVKINSIMTIEDITDQRLKDQELSAANVRQFIASEINRISTEYGEKLDSVQQEVTKKQTEASEAQTKLESIADELAKVKEELDAEKQKRAAEQAQAAFNLRMADLNEKYNLEDKDREVIAKRIKDLDEAGYASWFEEFSTLAVHKDKNYKAASLEEAKASVDDILEKATEEEKSAAFKAGVTERNSAWANAFKLEDIVQGIK
jgi:hypothetical protein